MHTLVFLKNLLVIIICCLAMQLNGQVTLGIRSGYTMAWKANVTWDDNDAYIHKGGFQASILSYVDIGKCLSLGMEPGYVRRVSSLQFESLIDTSVQNPKVLLNYIELPVMISAKYPLWSDRWEINVKMGYGLAFMASAYWEFPSKTGNDPAVKEKVIRHDVVWLNNFDHGLYGGVGIAYKIGNSRFFLETDYYMGFSDVIIFNSSKNRSVHIGSGYKITF